MNAPITLPNPKVTITSVGLQVTGQLTFDEWRELAQAIGQASRSIGFIIGDWLVYGQELFGVDGYPDKRVDSASYQLAIASTGLDLSTLQNYAYVSRKVPYSLRSERLSWEQQGWIQTCEEEEDAGRRISTRRLRKSISLGRMATETDLEPEPSDKGVDNPIPFINRLVSWWRRMQTKSFLNNATREQREALKRDLEPIVSIYNQL